MPSWVRDASDKSSLGSKREHRQRVVSGHRQILCWGLAVARLEIQGPQLAAITFTTVVSVKNCWLS